MTDSGLQLRFGASLQATDRHFGWNLNPEAVVSVNPGGGGERKWYKSGHALQALFATNLPLVPHMVCIPVY